MTIEEKIHCICHAISHKKGVQIRILHVTEITSVADYFILSTVRNPKQAQAAADEVEEQVKLYGESVIRREGYREGEWILLDFGDIVVHIFTDEERRRYELDHLWSEAPVTVYEDDDEENNDSLRA